MKFQVLNKITSPKLLKTISVFIIILAVISYVNQKNKEQLLKKLEYHFNPGQHFTFEIKVNNKGKVLTSNSQKANFNTNNQIDLQAKIYLELFANFQDSQINQSSFPSYSFA